eukprot:5888823-Pleurochrysis_carterae.AAC.1
MQTDGSPPAGDRLKSFTLDKSMLAKLLALKLVDPDLINFGIFTAKASRRGKLMVSAASNQGLAQLRWRCGISQAAQLP